MPLIFKSGFKLLLSFQLFSLAVLSPQEQKIQFEEELKEKLEDTKAITVNKLKEGGQSIRHNHIIL